MSVIFRYPRCWEDYRSSILKPILPEFCLLFFRLIFIPLQTGLEGRQCGLHAELPAKLRSGGPPYPDIQSSYKTPPIVTPRHQTIATYGPRLYGRGCRRSIGNGRPCNLDTLSVYMTESLEWTSISLISNRWGHFRRTWVWVLSSLRQNLPPYLRLFDHENSI